MFQKIYTIFRRRKYKMLYVEKRDGQKVEFNKEKVINAINAAFIEVDGMLYETDTAEDIADEIEKKIGNFYDRNLNATSIEDMMEKIAKLYSVEEIQDLDTEN